jgi:hypothetical protein
MKEAWCYLIYPVQETAHADIEWMSSKVAAQDGLLSRASKKLVSDQGIWPELGPDNLNRQLDKYVWNDRPHLSLRDIWEYLNRYTYLPRVQNRTVLAKAVHTAVSGMLPGPFAYAERHDDASGIYHGLAINGATGVQVVIDGESVIVRPDIAEAHRPKPPTPASPDTQPEGGMSDRPDGSPAVDSGGSTPRSDPLPTRFLGTVMISPDRPARDIHQIIESIVEQLTTLPGADVSIRLEIDAEVPAGLDRAKVRTLIENANTLGFIDKAVK